MTARGLNPRSLSLKAGLNPTAVRDMLEGRTKYPRYDTAQNLAEALGVTMLQLMGSIEAVKTGKSQRLKPKADDFDEASADLLTEIITHFQEVAEAQRHHLEPRDFAAMVTTLYRRVQNSKTPRQTRVSRPDVEHLLSYEALRQKTRRAKG